MLWEDAATEPSLTFSAVVNEESDLDIDLHSATTISVLVLVLVLVPPEVCIIDRPIVSVESPGALAEKGFQLSFSAHSEFDTRAQVDDARRADASGSEAMAAAAVLGGSGGVEAVEPGDGDSHEFGEHAAGGEHETFGAEQPLLLEIAPEMAEEFPAGRLVILGFVHSDGTEIRGLFGRELDAGEENSVGTDGEQGFARHCE